LFFFNTKLNIDDISKGEINLLTPKEQRPGNSQAKGPLKLMSEDQK
jgi:hypothetical protein